MSATNVTRAGKRGNICVRNNVSSFARALKKQYRNDQDALSSCMRISEVSLRIVQFYKQLQIYMW